VGLLHLFLVFGAIGAICLVLGMLVFLAEEMLLVERAVKCVVGRAIHEATGGGTLMSFLFLELCFYFLSCYYGKSLFTPILIWF